MNLEKIKIGMLVDTYLPIIGGAEIHVLELSRALRSLGYEVEVCTAVAGDEQVESEFPVLRLPELTGGNWRALLGIPKALPKLIKFIRQVDFVHCHYSFVLAMLGTVLAKLLGKRSAVTLHGLGTLDSSVDKSILFRFHRFVSLKCASTIIATSQEMKEVALRFAPEKKIVTIPNGVNTQTFIPLQKETDEPIIVLTMRRLAPKNGVQYLVEASPQVIAALPQVEFWVAGEGKLEAHVRQRVKELCVEQHFRFIGIVPHAQTATYYQRADIIVFPSSAESTSLACLEAMACEKGIVASNLTAYQDMLGSLEERGVLVKLFDRVESDYNAPLTLPSDRITEFASAILRMAKSPELRSQMGKRARQYVIANYDWQQVAKETVKLYPPAGTDL